MNFTFLVILSLLTLGFTYETLKITHKQMALIVIVLVILLVSYNIKEKFNTTENVNDDDQESALLFDTNKIKNVKNLFNADVKKQVRNDRDIKSELLNLKLA